VRFVRRGAIAFAALLFSGLVACTPPARRDEVAARIGALESPDIVFIVIDAQRADWTPPYGGDPDLMPELADWAEHGIVFEHTLAQSSWTKISMASVMTSLWPRTHGITEPGDGLAGGAVTLAEQFQAAGYQTFGVQTNGWLHQSFGFQQGFDQYLFPLGGTNPHFGKAALWPNADRVVEEASHMIAARDPERPLFLYLHFMDVHEYASPPEFKTFGTDSAGAYRAAMRWVDDGLARVREALEDAGTLDRTVLVLAADHGEAFGENGIHGHARNVLTPVLRVPLVVRFPFATEPIRVETQVRNIDIAPTLLGIAVLDIPEAFEGASLLPLVTESSPAEDRPVFATLGFPLFPDASVQRSFTDGAWTYARNLEAREDEPGSALRHGVAPGKTFLFDRSVDPGENVNLVAREPARAKRMRERIDAHWAAGAHREAKEEGVRIDPSIAERLRAMGYLR